MMSTMPLMGIQLSCNHQGRRSARGLRREIIDVLELTSNSRQPNHVLDEEKPKYTGYILSKESKISQRIYVKNPTIRER